MRNQDADAIRELEQSATMDVLLSAVGAQGLRRLGNLATDAAKAARDAGHHLPGLDTVAMTEREVRRLDGEKRGLVYIQEASRGGNAAQDFQAGTSGAYSDIGSRKMVVPALRYDNLNPNGNPFVKFDGIETASDGKTVLLIDAKTKMALWSEATQRDTRDTLRRVKAAIEQNPGHRVVYEFPNQKAVDEARKFIRNNELQNIVSVRVRKP